MNIENKPFHFIAIGGVGQSALAEILLKLGYKVSGSDIKESKYTNLVKSLGAEIFIGHSENNIKENVNVVISSAIKEDNPELIKARKLNLNILHRSDCLKFISELFPSFIGLAGTHGKTTTSGLLSYILEKINQNPSYAIGGILPDFNKNARADKNSKYFIAELDESDGTIVKYNPKYLLINNLEADHLDYYKNGLDDIIDTFKTMLNKNDNLENLFINIDNIGNQKLINEIKNKNIITYSINQLADYRAKNIEFDEEKSSFDFYKKDVLIGKINLIIPGVHNIYNALGICAILDTLRFNFDDYSKYFSLFKGMGRRFQLVSDKNKVKIIDDYAHHPSEINSTLSAIENFKRRKIAIFQPHRYTRLKALWEEFLNCFNKIDILFVLDTYSAGDKFDCEFNSKKFSEILSKTKENVYYIDGNIEQAAQKIVPYIKENDLILTLGAGDVTKLGGVIDDLLSK